MKNKSKIVKSKPLATYDMATSTVAQNGIPELVWACILDKRYKIEVVRHKIDADAELIIYDSKSKDKIVHRRDVFLSYGAKFGPDISDVVQWQKVCMMIVDKL